MTIKDKDESKLMDIGVLTRREVEARILAPLIDALGNEFGREKVIGILRATIIRIAEEQGALLSQLMGGDSLEHFYKSLEFWTKDGALEVETIEQTDEVFSFNATRCRYAELYEKLGIAELGTSLSCARDFALIKGFNPNITLKRTQTIMEGADFCDFRYHVQKHED
jgi:predicted ArsR family transcriptional regulator